MIPIHQNLPAIILIAKDYAKKHQVNYNIVLLNPDEYGEFNEDEGSTYEFVVDQWLEETQARYLLLHTTDELLEEEKQKTA